MRSGPRTSRSFKHLVRLPSSEIVWDRNLQVMTETQAAASLAGIFGLHEATKRGSSTEDILDFKQMCELFYMS